MTELNAPLGPVAIFSGAMDTTIERNVRQIRMIEDSIFATLQYQFTYANADESAIEDTAADASGVTFPALLKIQNVKSFKLTSGTVEVVFAA